MSGKRNNKLFDIWSLGHLALGILFGWALNPYLAFGLLVLWEPFEIFILSPRLAAKNIIFGHESLRNSLSDIVFDFLGVVIGATLLISLIDPPFFRL